MEVLTKGANSVLGEADVLMLTTESQLIPVEVKRTSTGFTASEVGKLDALADHLKASWSMAAVCQYGKDVDPAFSGLEDRSHAPDSHFRALLSYDALLNPMPMWTLGGDPFAWTPMADEQVNERQN
jgi:hypothetical protein